MRRAGILCLGLAIAAPASALAASGATADGARAADAADPIGVLIAAADAAPASSRAARAPAGVDPIGLLIAAANPTPAAPTSTVGVQKASPLDQNAGLTDNPALPPAPGASGPTTPNMPNPFGRDIDLTVSVMLNGRTLGEAPVQLLKSGQTLIYTRPFLDLVTPALSKSAAAKLAAAFAGKATFQAGALGDLGLSVGFDSAALAMSVAATDPATLAPQDLFANQALSNEAHIQPQPFSAYSNISLGANYVHGAVSPGSPSVSQLAPQVDLTNAITLGHFVLESDITGADGQYGVASTNGGNFEFYRQYVRGVYDIPSWDVRLFGGDLQPLTRGDQGSTYLGGIGFARQIQYFEPSRQASLFGLNQLVLQHSSTVAIYQNGTLIKQLNLGPGAYNVNNLPLLNGSNNLQIRVQDSTGAIQTLNYSAFLDPIDLYPGDSEYGAYIGALAGNVVTSPDYDQGLAFTGYYRKALLDSQAFGVGLQVSRQVAFGNAQYRFILPNAASLQFDLDVNSVQLPAADAERKTGGSLVGLYQQQFVGPAGIDSAALQVRYQTSYFQPLAAVVAPNLSPEWTVDASYSHAFNSRLDLTAELSYNTGSGLYGQALAGPVGSSSTLQIQTDYRLTRQITVRAGVEYEDLAQSGGAPHGFGGLLSLIWQPTLRDRIEARGDSLQQTEELTASHSASNDVGGLNYEVDAQNAPGDAQLDGTASYQSNRFVLSASQSAVGSNFGHVTGEQESTVSFSTSLAYAGGHFGVGRPIEDSFALVYPDASLAGHAAIIGENLQGGEAYGMSGLLGAGVDPFLPSYLEEPVRYDAVNAPAGYDIGSGVAIVKPSYRSGYAVRVGSDNYVSAVGTLVGQDDKAANLASGQVTDLDQPTAVPQPFFTNSAGRFVVPSLRPGDHYRVDLYGPAKVSFTIDVPKASPALYNLQTVKSSLPAQ